VPKHSENHFEKICAPWPFLNTVFGQPSFLGRKKIQGSITCTPFGLLIFFVFVAVFLVNSWGERRNVHWNIFQYQKWKP
jgi:hypothetical protein